MSKALFITGTGTDTGKTYITGLITKKLAEVGLHPAYYKAAMSGNDRRADGSLMHSVYRLCPASLSDWKICVLMYMSMLTLLIWLPGWKDIRFR